MSEFYSGKGKNLTSHKLSDQPPFPGGKMNNIFWLVQVSCTCTHLILVILQ